MSTSVGQGIQSGADYAWQEFFDVLCGAVTSTAGLQARLATLVLGVCHLRQQNFPDDHTWARFENLLTACSSHSAKASAAKILTTTAKMTEEEAGKWLQEAVQIFAELSEEDEL